MNKLESKLNDFVRWSVLAAVLSLGLLFHETYYTQRSVEFAQQTIKDAENLEKMIQSAPENSRKIITKYVEMISNYKKSEEMTRHTWVVKYLNKL
jgi:hypothetical protein